MEFDVSGAVASPELAAIRTETIRCVDCALSQLYSEDGVEIDLVLRGNGVHRIFGQPIPCKEGDVFVLRAQTAHRYEAEEPDSEPEVWRILFDPSRFFEGEPVQPEHARYCYGVFRDGAAVSCATLNKKKRAEVEHLFNAIAVESEGTNAEWQDALRAHLTVLLIALSRYVNSAIRNLQTVSSRENRLVLSVIRRVGEEFSSPALTLEALSEALFVSKSHLSRLFKRCTGQSFSEYLRSVRMNHACRLLQETSLTVDEISARCGLRDLPSFYSCFHDCFRMTPTKYRNQYSKILNNNPKEKRIMIILSEISENLQKGKAKVVKEMVQTAIDEGAEPAKILNEGLLDGMNVIGEKFKNNEVYVPEVLVAARAMNMGLAILKPHLLSSGVKATGKVCIGTVQGDLHDIGKNIVKMMLEGKGLEVVDLGVDVPAETFVQTAKEQGCQVICCSALLTTTMDVMAEVVKAAEAAGIRDQVKIMVGGAPVNEDFCKSIGADCYTVDAASAADAAVELCKSLM